MTKSYIRVTKDGVRQWSTGFSSVGEGQKVMHIITNDAMSNNPTRIAFVEKHRLTPFSVWKFELVAKNKSRSVRGTVKVQINYILD